MKRIEREGLQDRSMVLIFSEERHCSVLDRVVRRADEKLEIQRFQGRMLERRN